MTSKWLGSWDHGIMGSDGKGVDLSSVKHGEAWKSKSVDYGVGVHRHGSDSWLCHPVVDLLRQTRVSCGFVTANEGSSDTYS